VPVGEFCPPIVANRCGRLRRRRCDRLPYDFVAKSELDALPRRHRSDRLDQLDVRD
jgi:hypothetical protein